MAEYQSISAGRACLQAATLLCAYAAARYQKLKLPRTPALAFVAAGVLQGVSNKVRTPLGERSKWNWLLDGVSLGLVAYETSKLELAKRVKYLTGGVMGGAQVLISNARPHTFFGRIAAIDVDKAGAEDEVNALYDELAALKDQLTPQDLIRACTTILPKTLPFVGEDFENSAAGKLQTLHIEAIEHLAGWEKAVARMHFYEVSNEHGIYFSEMVMPKEGLSAAELGKRQEWLDTTGLWIRQRWSILVLEKEGLEESWNALEALIKAPDCRLTFDQKIDLCKEYIVAAYELHGGIKLNLCCEKACTFEVNLIEGLEGFAKCQAYMKHAEFFSSIGIKWSYLFNKIFPEIEQTLSSSEKRQFQKWMIETGNAIKQKWR